MENEILLAILKLSILWESWCYWTLPHLFEKRIAIHSREPAGRRYAHSPRADSRPLHTRAQPAFPTGR